jgi:hypothetical protein
VPQSGQRFFPIYFNETAGCEGEKCGDIKAMRISPFIRHSFILLLEIHSAGTAGDRR